MEEVVVSGIPFMIRSNTVDRNVLEEVIEGDCYRLNAIGLRKKPNVVDVGGHIGAFTKLAAWKWPRGKFFVYEANPRNYDLLTHNLASISDKTTIFKGACVGKVPANKRIQIAKGEGDRVTGGWGIIYGDKECDPDPRAEVQPIDTFYNLSDLFVSLDKVDVLKLDCEGSEFTILKHLTDEELHKIDYLVCEVHCGALPHQDWTYEGFRNRILKHFVCPELAAKPTASNHDLFNIVACNRKLLP